jgi:hypothetical protein
MSTNTPASSAGLQPRHLIGAAVLGAGLHSPAFAFDDPARTWYMHAGGWSHHMQQTRAEGRRWNEVHPGIGFETRRVDDSGWTVRQGLGAMQDSRGFWGGYAGVGWLHRWSIGRGASFSAGAGAYAFYRSVSWSGERALVPAVLPTASLDLLDHTVGVNLVAVPPLRGFGGETVPSITMQFVVRVR